MKKLWILALVAGLGIISGCSDASAQISDEDKVLFRVGEEEITREDMYATYRSNSASFVIQEATKYITEKEVKTTDELKEKAQSELDTFLKTYGDEADEFITMNGYKDRNDYRDRYILLNLKSQELAKTYVKDDFKKLAKKYNPIKVQVLETSDKEKAQTALTEIKNGADFATVTKNYGTTKNFDGSATVITNQSSLPETIYKNVLKEGKRNTLMPKVLSDATTGNYYVIQVIELDPNPIKDEAIEAMSAITSMNTIAFTHYLEQYDFHIYDIDVYHDIDASQPDYIVQ